jgi:bacteriochlorophyllide a dehydrogenase
VPTTTAIVIPEPHRLELREVELTAPGPDDLVIRTAYTSISAGTERMLLAGRMPHPMLAFPVIPGYETVGRVVSAGANVDASWEGRWVYAGGARCYAGVNPAWGGQSATLIADHRRVVPLDGMEPRLGVLLALSATALHGVDLLAGDRRVTADGQVADGPSSAAGLAGRRVLVLGQGPVGQLAARIARAHGAWVAVADRAPSRLERSQADLSLDVAGSALAEVGEPVDAIVEATGSMGALAEALPLLASDGSILLLGYYDELRLPYMPLFLKQARLLTAREWAPGDLARSRDMIATGALDVAGLITHTFAVTEYDEAYRVALDEPECLKLVMEWE